MTPIRSILRFCTAEDWLARRMLFLSGPRQVGKTTLQRAAETGAPVVVTLNGKPAGVLLSPGAFDALTEQARFVAAVSDGLADARAERVHEHEEVQRRMRARFGAKGE